MASLKDINSSIEEGNEDLEKLNKNFAKWFASQKTSGDDLEAAAERRNRKVKAAGGGVTNIFNRTEKKGGLSLPGGLLTKAAIAAVVAAAIAAALKYLKNNNMDPATTLADGTFAEVYNNPNSSPFSGSTIKQAFNKINSQKARLKIANARLAGQLRTANTKLMRAALLIDDLENPKKARVIRTESRQDIKNRVNSGGTDKITKTNSRIDKSLQRGGKTQMTASGQKIFNGSKLVVNADGKSRFTALTPDEKAQFQKNKIAIQNKVAAGTAANTSARRGALKVNTAMVNMFNNIKKDFKMHLDGAKAMPRPGMGWKTGQAYGQAIMDYLQGKTPAPVQKFLKIFLHPRLLGIGFSVLSIFEVALIWQNKKLHLTKILPGGEPAIVDHQYTRPEQIAATAAVVTGLGAAILGATIGGIIGTMAFGPIGSFAGSLIGGYLGYQQMGVIVQFVYDIANRQNLAFYGEELNAFKARMTAKSVTEANTISGNAVLNDFEATSKGILAANPAAFDSVGGGEAGRINAVKAFATKNNIATNFQNPAYSDKRNMLDSQRGTAIAKQKTLSRAQKLINSGLSLLGIKTASAGASEMSLPSVSNGLLALGENTPTMGPGTNGAPPVIVDASSKSFSDHKSVHMMPPITPHTVDTSLTFFNSVGPMSNLERARMR